MMDPSVDVDSVKVKLSSKIDKKAPAFIANFSCGRLNENNDMRFECFKHQKETSVSNRFAKRILVAQSNHMTYTGSSSDDPKNQPLRYFIGVRNKQTGKMKLYDSVFFHLKPNLPSAAASVRSDTVTPVKNYWEERNMLTAAFGGKSSKRALNSRMKFAVNADSFEDTINDNASITSPIPFLINSESTSEMSYLPLINRAATSLEEVFDISDIISPEEDFALQSQVEIWLEIFKSDLSASKANFCNYVLYRVEQAVNDHTKLKFLLYYNYLVIFKHLSVATIRKKDPSPLIPEPFKQTLLDKFTSISTTQHGKPTKVVLPQQKDKLAAYLLVLALQIDNYCVNMNHILSDLKRFNPKHFSTIAETMGCYVTTKKIDGQSIKFAELKLPLNFVRPKFIKK